MRITARARWFALQLSSGSGPKQTPETHGEALSDIVTSLTINDLLDALEAGVVSLHARPAAPASQPAPAATAVPAVPARVGSNGAPVPLQEAGVAPRDFSAMFGIDGAQLYRWLAGSEPIPHWVETSIHILGALPPSVRRLFVERSGPRPRTVPVRTHPFSRIEDL